MGTGAQDAARSTPEPQLLAECVELVALAQDLPEAQGVLLGYLPGLFPGTRGALFASGGPGGVLVGVGGWGGIEPPDQLGPEACWGWRTNAPHEVRPGSPRPRCAHLVGPWGICAPLVHPEGALGLVQLEATSEQPPGLPAGWVVAVTGVLGRVLGLLVATTALAVRAATDPLTGVHNRRFFEQRFDTLVAQALGAQQPLSVLAVDLDEFKTLNDTRGHLAGDQVLRQVAHLLQAHTRPEDHVVRTGGDEFVVVLPGASLVTATTRAQHLHQALSAIASVSIGVASAPQDTTSPQELLEIADQRLRHAKTTGKGHTRPASTTPP